ncbi:unnamed protein product, partial [Staurois parvus]
NFTLGKRTCLYCSRVLWRCALHRCNQHFGDVRLGCSYSAMETHSMKLSTHCCCANLRATRSLDVFSY